MQQGGQYITLLLQLTNNWEDFGGLDQVGSKIFS